MMDRVVARKFWMGFVVVKNLLIVLLAGIMIPLGSVPLLFGAVVYAVSSLDAVFTLYRDEDVKNGRSIVNFGLYCAFFPRLYAGPVQPYREFSPQLGQVSFQFRSLLVGLGQFVQGGLKVALIARQCAELFVIVSGFGAYDTTVLSLWSAALLFGFWLYFTLSGYCDMAQGIGAMFGLFLPRNFYYPYQSRSIADFFERFNMTLTAFLKKNLPVLKKNKIIADALGIVLIGILFGLWFGLRVNDLLWGVFLSAFVLIGRLLPARLSSIIPVLIRRILTFGVILVSFSLMIHENVFRGISHMGGMLGFGGYAVYNEQIMYQLASNLILLSLAAFLCTSAISLLVRWAQKTIPRITMATLTIINAALLVLLTAIIY